MKKYRAFTLIELLVVIAIVGILSGFIFVSLSEATNKATIAASQMFSDSVNNSLLMNTVLKLKLDNDVADSWGSNVCSFNGTGPANYRPSSECIFGQCLRFNGTDNYLDCGNDFMLSPSNKITVAVWFKKSSSSANNMGIVSKHTWISGSPSNIFQGYLIDVESNDIYFIIGDGVNGHLYVYANMKAQANTWYYVVGTFIPGSPGIAKIYVNGQLKNSGNAYYAPCLTANLSIGRFYTGGSGGEFEGTIDEVRIYNESIVSAQIRGLYLAGLFNLLGKNKITQDEYNNHITELNENIAQGIK